MPRSAFTVRCPVFLVQESEEPEGDHVARTAAHVLDGIVAVGSVATAHLLIDAELILAIHAECDLRARSQTYFIATLDLIEEECFEYVYIVERFRLDYVSHIGIVQIDHSRLLGTRLLFAVKLLDQSGFGQVLQIVGYRRTRSVYFLRNARYIERAGSTLSQ